MKSRYLENCKEEDENKCYSIMRKRKGSTWYNSMIVWMMVSFKWIKNLVLSFLDVSDRYWKSEDNNADNLTKMDRNVLEMKTLYWSSISAVGLSTMVTAWYMIHTLEDVKVDVLDELNKLDNADRYICITKVIFDNNVQDT